MLREDFEALLNDARDEPDQTPLEREMLAAADRVVAEFDDADSLHSDRALVEARIVQWALAELGAQPTA